MSAQQAEAVEFKVVHKRSSNQGRRVERPPHSSGSRSHTSHSDETSSTRKRPPLHHLPHREKGDKEVRLRPQTHRSSGSSRGETNRSSSSRDKDEHSHHHSHSRHRSSNSSSLDNESSKGTSKVDKITSPNRFEKLEKLDPDMDIDNESSSSAKSSRSSDSDKKRAAGSHKTTSSGGGKSGSHHRKGLRDTDTVKSGRDKGQHTMNKSNSSESGIGKEAVSPKEVCSNGDVNKSSSTVYTSLESSELSTQSLSDSLDWSKDDSSVADVSQSDSNQHTGKELPNTSAPAVEETKNCSRISYTRDELLALKSKPLSLYRPKQLDSCDPCILKSQSSSSSASSIIDDRLASLDDTESATPEGGKPSKHPTALTLIREYGDNKLGKVNLSPQRRSFHSGCSWTTTPGSSNTSTASEAPPPTPPPNKNGYYTEKRDGQHFDFESHAPTTTTTTANTSGNQRTTVNYQAPPTPSGRVHTPRVRVIDHIPLMDREQHHQPPRHKKSNSWRERNTDWRRGTSNYQPREEEPEPEWMEFGPTDRYDVIELKGMDEHEREREARNQPDSQLDDTTANQSEELDSESPLKRGGDDQQHVTEERVESEPVEPEETVSNKPLEVHRNPPHQRHQRQQRPKREEMDEYMLEGFDFSTGVSICKELDLDEEEGDGKGELFSSSVETPSQLSNALMRALKVGGQGQKINGQDKRSRPANVLTLDEIQARENIQPVSNQSSESTSDELGAFNKLVAVLQSSGAIHEGKKQPQPQKVLPKPVGPSYPPQEPPRESTTGSNNFGYLLEKELDFEERMMAPPPPPREHPTTLISRGDPPVASLSRLQTIERMLENLDRSHAHTTPIPPPSRGFGPIPPPPPPHAGIPSPMSILPPNKRATPTQRDQPHPLDSDGGWMYPPEGVPDVRHHAPPPPEMYRPSNHRQIAGTNRPYQMMSSSGASGRSNANNWAVEMERRRILELQQMQLKERMERDRLQQQQHSLGPTPPQAKVGPSSRPNISLLPTSVMRHMHNSNKSTQPQHIDTMPKSSPASHMANRLDQELTSKASQTHSAISSLLNHSTDVSPNMDYPTTITNASRMRAPPPPPHGHAHHMMHHVTDPSAPMMYQRYNMPTMLHGIPAQQNPYMY